MNPDEKDKIKMMIEQKIIKAEKKIVDYKEMITHIEEQTQADHGVYNAKDSDGWGASGEASRLLNDLWKNFRTKHSKVINYLAKEFEMKDI